MPSALEASRLYAILDTGLVAARGLTTDAVLDGWLSAGVRLIQFRSKGMATGPMLELAERLVRRASSAGAVLVVNDRADIARMSGAAGVHVGQDDLSPADARKVVGPAALVGLSTHNDDQARAAIRESIDYLAIGPVFVTSTKDRPDPVVGLQMVRETSTLAAIADVPVVGIGGITLANAGAVIEAGAAAVAVISDLLTGDPEARAREFLKVLR